MGNVTAGTEKRDLVVTCIFDAPLGLVWQAWTDPEHVMRWWGPTGFTSPFARMDVREGGTSLVCMRAPKEFGGQDYYNTWAYTKIVPMQHLEFIQDLTDKEGNLADPVAKGLPADFPRGMRSVVTFRDLGNGKTEMVVTEYNWTVGHMLEMSELGLNQCLDKMAASFAAT
jgi:uncharacterized protein YndB with AHSA1/START domain